MKPCSKCGRQSHLAAFEPHQCLACSNGWTVPPVRARRVVMACADCGGDRLYEGPATRCGDWVSVPGHECKEPHP